MWRAISFIVFGLISFHGLSQEEDRLDFSLLRQDDNIVIEQPDSFYEKLKAIKLGNNSSLSFGGSYRFQTEAFINEQFDKNQDQTDYWFLNRFMLHAHLKVNDKVEIFSELNSSLINSKDNLVPVDRDELSFNQFFFKYRFSDHWELLLGRQNMRLGSGRLVDVREGPNVRLSFDMAQLQFKDENTEVTTFHAIPVRQQEGIFDNDALEGNEALSALYWTQNWTENTNTDIYLLYKTEESKTWNSGMADDDRA
ncbi:MAG: porin, partial [Bacteroidota bacterium]